MQLTGNWEENEADNLESSIYDSERPFGPFTCTACGKEEEELKP